MKGSDKRMHRFKFGFFHPNFKYYALYAFGIPAVVSMVTIIMQKSYDKDAEGIIHPRINDGTCQLGRSVDVWYDAPYLWYFHIINSIVLVNKIQFIPAQY